MGFFSNKVDREALQVGDHIYSWRGALKSYAHHGIYIGDGQVIHFGAGSNNTKKTTLFRVSVISNSIPRHECPKCNYHLCPNGVTMSCLDCFLDGGKLYRYEYNVKTFYLSNKWPGTCTRAVPDSVDVVLHRAKYLLQHGFGKYHLWKHNCEDFALYCKTSFICLEGGASAQAASWKIYPRFLWVEKEILGPKAKAKKVEVEDLAKMFCKFE